MIVNPYYFLELSSLVSDFSCLKYSLFMHVQHSIGLSYERISNSNITTTARIYIWAATVILWWNLELIQEDGSDHQRQEV